MSFMPCWNSLQTVLLRYIDMLCTFILNQTWCPKRWTCCLNGLVECSYRMNFCNTKLSSKIVLLTCFVDFQCINFAQFIQGFCLIFFLALQVYNIYTCTPSTFFCELHHLTCGVVYQRLRVCVCVCVCVCERERERRGGTERVRDVGCFCWLSMDEFVIGVVLS